MSDELYRLLTERNRSGDLDAIPVPIQDNSTFMERLKAYLSGGGWQDPQPGQRGTFVPGKVGDDGKVSPAVPGIIHQPAEGLYGLMTAPLSDIVRSGDRDAMRAASEASFDVASMLPAAGVAAGRMRQAPQKGVDLGITHTVPDHSYDRQPYQQDWMRGYPPSARTYRGQDRQIGLGYARGRDFASDGVDVIRDFEPAMPKPGQDPVPGVRRIDGGSVYSNPDDVNTAAVLAAMQGQERPTAGLAGAKPGTGAGAGRLAGAPEPIGQPSGRQASGLPGLAPDSSPGQPAQGPRATIESDPYLKAWADHLGLDYDGLLSPSIAQAAADGQFAYYGVRTTERPLTVGEPAKNSFVWDRDKPTKEELPGPSTVGLRLSEDGIEEARKHVYDYDGQNVSLIGSNYRMYGADDGEWILPGGQVVDAVVRPVSSDWRRVHKLFSNPDDLNTPAVLAAMQGQERPKGITAYHGSPHDFDRFDMSKIGTGEGAQAYGHGLYFAENEGTANTYRHKLSERPQVKSGGQASFAPDSPEAIGQAKIADYVKRRRLFGDDPTPDEAANAVIGELDRHISRAAQDGNFDIFKQLSDQRLAVERMREQGLTMNNPGRMYEVRINADPDRFIDFDLQHNEQSSFVNEALAKARAQGRFPEAPRRYIPRTPEETNALRDAGIPGIRYLDQGSRGAGEGSRNYVVFDDALVEILRKYANAPDPTTAAILALLTAQQGAQPQQ